MDYIQEWFTQYKITADSLWINYYNPNEWSNPSDITISNSIVLGSQGGATHSQGLFLIFMRPIGSSGTISLQDFSESIVIENDTAGTIIDQDMMSVQYQASNNYWIPQAYYYQMGGVFLKQNDGSVNRVAPLMNFYSYGGNRVAKIVIINITQGVSETNLISGEGPIRLDMVLKDRTAENYIPDDETTGPTITLTLRDEATANAWKNVLLGLGAPSFDPNPPDENQIIINGLDEVYYQYANYTVSLQSVATSVS